MVGWMGFKLNPDSAIRQIIIIMVWSGMITELQKTQ